MRAGISLDHPGWQQRQGLIRLADHQVIDATVALVAHDSNDLAHPWVERIADPNLTCQTPGSMTLFRPAAVRAILRRRRLGGDPHQGAGTLLHLVDLVNLLEQEKAAGRSGRLAENLRYDLIVIDELGYLPFSQPGGQLLFHLISKLYETPRC